MYRIVAFLRGLFGSLADTKNPHGYPLNADYERGRRIGRGMIGLPASWE